ncbi:MAG: hypothetical protein KAS62_03200, partial [Candidatus Delongbacteria bacterium]|nr:hypothetical protein [Candidatus Delongbacteria bacterium]
EDREIYSHDAYYPSSPVMLSKNSKIRGLDVVMLGITPFQYNPVTKELIVYRDIQVDVQFNGGNGHFGEDRLRNHQWDRILKNAVINPEVIKDVSFERTSKSKSTDFEYIILCPDDPIFISYANQLKEFRTKQGIRTGVVTTTDIGGNTEAAIETYINNAYNTWAIPPAAVLMLADWGMEGSTGALYAPKFFFNYAPYNISDNFYADVDSTGGNKGLPEIVFARMTAENETHLETMISKIINYETSPPTATNFYNEPITALGWQTERWFQLCSEIVAGYMKNELGKTPVRINALYEGDPNVDPWSTNVNTSMVTDYFGPSGTGYIPATPQELGGFTGGVASDITNALNSGAFILQHRDHGDIDGWGEPDFRNDDINSLTNTDLSFIFSVNCLTGKFDDKLESFAEKFHRYTYNGQNAGALGIIAATESSMSFVNDAYVWGMYDYFWPDFMGDYGSPATDNDEFLPAFANVSGKYFLDYSSWPYNPEHKELTNYLFHTHGDPYMTVYTEAPQNLTVVLDNIIDGQDKFNITADLGSNIALVANGVIIGTGTGTGSPIDIDIVPQLTSTVVIVTITKQNYFRYESNVVVGIPGVVEGGTYSQSVADLSYGNVTLGESSTMQFSITNSHGTESIVGTITTPVDFIVSVNSKSNTKNVIDYYVPVNTTRNYDLKFEPVTVGPYSSNVTITSSDTNHSTEYIAVTGECVEPDIGIDPASISASASKGNTD